MRFSVSNQTVLVRGDDELFVADSYNIPSDKRYLSFDPLAVDIRAGAVEVIEPDIVATVDHYTMATRDIGVVRGLQ